MPYIPQTERLGLAQGMLPNTTGQLNYLFSCLIDEYLAQHGRNYTNINAAIGALECAKMELYRRVAVPYEDHKKIRHGDVYTPRGIDEYNA